MAQVIPVGPRLERLIYAIHLAGGNLLLEGPTGAGKSTVPADVAARHHLGFIRLHVTVMEAPDLGGLPVPDLATGCMRYLRPTWMPAPDDTRGGIVLLDEINRAKPDVQNGLLGLMSEREINGHHLPPGWSVHATCNPAGKDFVHTEELDKAFAARFSRVVVSVDPKEWLIWARSHRVHSDVVAFVERHRDVFADPASKSNPRSWVKVSDFLVALQKMNSAERPDDDCIFIYIAGCVDDHLALEFLQSRGEQVRINHDLATNVLANYETMLQPTVRMQLKNKQIAEVRAIVDSVISYASDQDTLATDMLDPIKRVNLCALFNDVPGDLKGLMTSSISGLKDYL